MTFKGLVKSGESIAAESSLKLPASVSPASLPALCQFEMKLLPGQNHVEARMVGPVRQTENGCEADFDVGIPTVIQPAPNQLGAPVMSASTSTASASTATGETNGHDNGNTPDLSPIFGNAPHEAAAAGNPVEAAATTATPLATGQPQFSSGYINGIVYDPVNIQVTYVNLYTGWVWTNTGVCVTNGSYSQYLTDYWPSGWFLASNQPTEYTNCNGSVNYTYALFGNQLFCAAIYGPYTLPTYVYYWPIQIQGWQDGTLYGNFAWIIGGSQCSAWLTPTYQLNRSVN